MAKTLTLLVFEATPIRRMVIDEQEEQGDTPDDEVAGGDLPKAVRQRLEAFLPEMVRKTFAAGIGAVFSTEEGIRKLAKELTLPKDVANYLVGTAASTKDEVMRLVAIEVREFLKTVQISDEIARLLTKLQLDVKTEIRFSPAAEKAGGVKPEVNAKVAVKKSADPDESSEA